FDRTFGDAQGAVDALVRIDHQKIGTFAETVDGADIDAIGVFAADAALGHYVSHQPSTPEPAITSILAKFTPEPVWRSPRNLLVAMLSQRMSPPHSLDRAACRRYTFGLT